MKPVYLLLLIFVSPWALSNDSGDQMSAEGEIDNARLMIESTNFKEAIRTLKKVVKQDDRNADAWNLLGYSHRKLGNLTSAADAYKRALLYDPKHKGALEYQGELYIEMEDLDSARTNLNRLIELCPEGCEELDDLKQALALKE